MIFLLPTIRAVRRGFPKAAITLVTGPYSSAHELVQMGSDVDDMRIIDWTQASIWGRIKTCLRLRAARFDACLVSYPNPVRFFLPALANIPIRIGHCRKPSYRWSLAQGIQRFRHWVRFNFLSEEFYRRVLFNQPVWIDVPQSDEHDIGKSLRMAAALGVSKELLFLRPGVEVPAEANSFVSAFLAKKGLSPQTKFVGFSLGVSAGMEWKRWETKRVAELLERLENQYGLPALLIGSPMEKGLEEEFRRYYHRSIVSAMGETNVMEVAALLSRCSVFISNDSGPSKLAMAIGVPTAILWGPSDRIGAGPWEEGRHLTVHNGTPCSPCYAAGLKKVGKGVINFENCGHRACLTKLSVEEVLNQIKSWMDQSLV